jgi:hypothetical protein
VTYQTVSPVRASHAITLIFPKNDSAPFSLLLRGNLLAGSASYLRIAAFPRGRSAVDDVASSSFLTSN